jgi:hypothetical protein
MEKLPPPLRNYKNLMLMAKKRLIFVEEHIDKQVGLLDLEIVAIQLRKIIEGVAYGCVAACELGGEKLPSAVLKAYDARKVFAAIEGIGFVPRPCVLTYTEDDQGIDDWNISKKKLPRRDTLFAPKDYLRAYKTLHRYAHEFHPRLPHHLLYKDGLERAISILEPIRKRLSNSLWQHVMPFGNCALLIDFGEKDDRPPKWLVFRQEDNGPAWPILCLVTDLK